MNEMEKDETSFFASTTPYEPQRPPDNVSPEDLIGKLKDAGRDTATVEDLMTAKMTMRHLHSVPSDRNRDQELLQWYLGHRCHMAQDILQGYQGPRDVHRNIRGREDHQVP